MPVNRVNVFGMERTNINLPGYLVEFNVVLGQRPFLITSEHYMMKIHPSVNYSMSVPP